MVIEKEKREFLIQTSVKRKKTGVQHDLKGFFELELDWQGNKVVHFDTVSERGRIISFQSKDGIPEPGGYFNYRFRLTKLEVVRDWKKDFFKDHVANLKLEPIQDEESIKIITHWGTRVDPSQYRVSRFLIVGFAFIALVGGVLVWLLWKKKRK